MAITITAKELKKYLTDTYYNEALATFANVVLVKEKEGYDRDYVVEVMDKVVWKKAVEWNKTEEWLRIFTALLVCC